MTDSHIFFNIYCDESRVENSDSKKMVIGALIIPRRLRGTIVNDIKNICRKYSFFWEIKWTKTNHKYIEFYKELTDYFVSQIAMNFRCIIVDKGNLDYVRYHDGDEELAFFKFYYLMLRQKLLDYNRYYIFLDRKPTRDKNRARALHAFLDSHTLLHKQDCSIEHFQAYPSHENVLLQLTDYLTGLVAYAVNVSSSDSAKFCMTEHLRKKLQRKTFLVTSVFSESKFNIFVWEGKDE